MSSRLQPFGPNIWIADGPNVNFLSFPYPTRMVVIRLEDGSAWIWSPIPISDALAIEVETTVGPVKHLVSPNKIHWLFLKQWKDRYPKAKMYASPGLAKRRAVEDLEFDATLTDQADPAYSNDIDQVVFEGGWLDEVIFFHKASQTVIVCDLIQRFPDPQPGWKGWIMKLDGLVGENGTAPGELRCLFWIRGELPKARQNLDRILAWQPEKLIVAHGENASEDATRVIVNGFRWVPLRPRECCSCFPKGTDESKED